MMSTAKITCNRELLTKPTNNNDEEQLESDNNQVQINDMAVPATTTKRTFVERWYPFGFRDEALTMIKITVPFSMGNVLASWLNSFISLAFLGHALGQTEVNACALALSTYVLIGNSLMLGLNFGCDTLLPQCFGGNKRKMGLILQRALIITGYACLISWTLMLNAKYALKWIEHDQQVVLMADHFLRSFLLALPLDGLAMLFQKYIASNEKTWPLLIINIIGNGINAISHYVCLYKLHLGIVSAPLSITLAYGSVALCALCYIRASSIYTETWYPITRACLREWDVYMRLSVPGIMMIVTEFWAIELSIFFAAHLSARSLSAQVCAYQTVWLLYLITSSFATAVNIRIGQFLGAGKSMQAANAKNVAYTVGALVILVNMCLIVLAHYWLPFAYNTEAPALTLARRVLLLVALLHIWDGYNIINTGIVKACGKQKRGAMISFGGFYLFGIPIAAVLMFVARIDIYGFWIGVMAAETVTNTLLFILVQRFNWERHAKAALVRIDFNPKMATAIATVSIDDEKKDESTMAQDDNDETWPKLIQMKVIVLVILICILIAGIVCSTMIPLY